MLRIISSKIKKAQGYSLPQPEVEPPEPRQNPWDEPSSTRDDKCVICDRPEFRNFCERCGKSVCLNCAQEHEEDHQEQVIIDKIRARENPMPAPMQAPFIR